MPPPCPLFPHRCHIEGYTTVYILQDLVLCKVGKKQMCGTVEQAVAKLLTTSIYYTITSVLALAVESYSASITPNHYLTALLPYFTCESTGYDETKDCKRLLAEIQQTHLLNLSLSFTVMYPFTFSYLATKVLHDKFNACKFVTIYLRKYSASPCHDQAGSISAISDITLLARRGVKN